MTNIEDLSKFVLCYIDGVTVYFTTNLKNQSGDDWDGSTIENNAEPPYEPMIHHYGDRPPLLSRLDWNEDKSPKYQLLKVDVTSKNIHELFEWTSVIRAHKGVSVNSLLNLEHPWMKVPDSPENNSANIEVFAGTSYPEFVEIIALAGAEVDLTTGSISSKIYPKAMPELEFKD